MSGTPGLSESDSAVQLFVVWLDDRDSGRGPSFEELCSSHPELRPRLIELESLHQRARSLLEPEDGHGASPPPVEPEPRLDGTRYEVRGQIARGGMGAILEADDPGLKRTIAIKVLRERAGPDSSAQDPTRARHEDRLLAEAQILAQLDHPGVVPIYEVGRDARGSPYFAMKRVKGQDFLAVIQAHHAGDVAWSLARAVGVLKQACLAVAYAHQKGVIHRDLKPANVMVGRFGEVFVMDWGLAKILGQGAEPDVGTKPGTGPLPVRTDRARNGEPADPLSDTQHGAVLGTPGYMAPEQAAGDIGALDARTDVYALGAMLYHLLAGSAPHVRASGMSSTEFVLETLRRKPERLSRAAPSAPDELVAICERAMAQRPEARYASALDLAGDLRAWLERRVVRAHRTGVWIELRKWARRNPGGASAVAALLLGIGATTLVQLRSRAELALQAEELRREYAHGRIALASAALSSGEIGHMQELLAGCDSDLRGWEWDYLSHAADTSAATLEVTGIDVHAVAFLDEGRTILTAGSGSPARILLWDRASRRLVRELALPPGHFINSVGVSADGELLAAFGRAGDLSLWETCGWTRLPSLDVPLHGWQGVESAPAGRLLAAFGTEGVHLWDAEQRSCVAMLSAGQRDISDVAWSPDASRLCAASWDGSVSVWAVASAELVELLQVTSARMEHVEWSPDGRWIAGGDWDSRVHVWDAHTLRPVQRSDRLEGQVLTLAWSPDSTLLAVGGVGTIIHVFEAGTWEEVGRLTGHASRVQSLAFAPDGRALVSACALGVVHLWDLADARWRTQHRASGREPPAAIAFAPDSARVAVGWGNGQVEIWNPATHARERSLDSGGSVRHLDWSRGVPRLAVAKWEADILLFDATLARPPARIAVKEPTEVHFDPSGSLLAATAQDGTLQVWELGSGHLLWTEHVPIGFDRWPGKLFGASWSPSGDEVVTCSDSGRIQVRSGAYGELLRETRRPEMVFAQFSRDGRHILAWAYAGLRRMELLDSQTLTPVWTSERTTHMWPVLAPDGTRIFSANWQGNLGVWDAASGRLVAEIDGLPPGNPRLGVSPDGTSVALAVGSKLRFFEAGR